MKLKFYISLCICIISAAITAQEATLKTSISKNKLGINQRLRVEFSIDKQGGDNFTPPNFTNFKVVGGPSQSVSQSWINGDVSFRQSYTYIVQPKKKGELSIGSATVKINGKLIRSTPVKIIVLDAV
ncbi:MAG TPA: BatD protein, partial [Polaribacter sp.]|nr:BatD protein [Polaribacter sp.]